MVPLIFGCQMSIPTTGYEQTIAECIHNIWLLLRYTRGSKGSNSFGPMMIRLSESNSDTGLDWFPVDIGRGTPAKVVFATAAGILNADSETHSVLFLFESNYGGDILYGAWMMMVFSRNGIGPVALASVDSCLNLYNYGPEIKGSMHSEENIDLIEDYLSRVDDVITRDCMNPPENGFSVSDKSFSLDFEATPQYFKSLLNSKNVWN